ncbi:VanZ family protein [Taibaiella chishuiensis]|uniref:VanZ family protein n=1 Tax=Taibaiella chishuiensis TaxID=1434707 RepID=A0A2P8CX41_9BACT|nr:VanZ family protein [Taibaiella chishuiensis]PSK89496.1 VanZ family protein [Taibaiella chishuiensis]
MKQIFFFFTANKNRAILFAVLWTLLILVACFIPGREVPDVRIPFIDKWVHFVLFGGFSFLWLCTRKRAVPCTGLVVFLASVALGYGVELIQGSGITSGRSYDMYDVYADSVGGLLGVLLFFLWRRTIPGEIR